MTLKALRAKRCGAGLTLLILWASLSTAYGSGLQATINGLPKDNKSANWVTAVSVGFPISRTQGLKFSWFRFRAQKDTGANLDSLVAGWSLMF